MPSREPIPIEQSVAAEALELEIEGKLARARFCSKLRVLWIERRFLCRLMCIGVAFATLAAFLIAPRFGSSVQIMPPDSQAASSVALMAGLAGQAGGWGALAGDMIGIRSTGALFMGVLQSRTVQDRIIARFDLKAIYRVRLEEMARQKLAENTSVSEDRKSGIISLSVADRDPKRAAAIAGAYVDELNTLMAQLTTSSARREREFLEQRLDSVRLDLDSAEKNFSQFASKNATVDITQQGKAMVESAAMLEGQLMAAESQLAGLKQIYSDSNVRVRATQARITELRRQLEKFGGKQVTPSDGNPAESGTLYPTLRQLPILGVPYADLYRRLKIEEAVYETLTKQYELAKVQEAKEIPTVKILDSPNVPERRSYPPRLAIVILGTLSALAVGVVWVTARSRWEEIDSQDPTRLLAAEVFREVRGRLPWSSANGDGNGRDERSH